MKSPATSIMMTSLCVATRCSRLGSKFVDIYFYFIFFLFFVVVIIEGKSYTFAAEGPKKIVVVGATDVQSSRRPHMIGKYKCTGTGQQVSSQSGLLFFFLNCPLRRRSIHSYCIHKWRQGSSASWAAAAARGKFPPSRKKNKLKYLTLYTGKHLSHVAVYYRGEGRKGKRWHMFRNFFFSSSTPVSLWLAVQDGAVPIPSFDNVPLFFSLSLSPLIFLLNLN